MKLFPGYAKNIHPHSGWIFQTVDEFVHCLKKYIHYWNNERISLKMKGMSPVKYRTHSKTI